MQGAGDGLDCFQMATCSRAAVNKGCRHVHEVLACTAELRMVASGFSLTPPAQVQTALFVWCLHHSHIFDAIANIVLRVGPSQCHKSTCALVDIQWWPQWYSVVYENSPLV